MYPTFRRRGFSLTELLIVIVMVGILVAIATPRVRRALLRSEVVNARNAMANMYTTARLTALQTSRTVILKRSGDAIHIAAWPRLSGPGTRDTIGAVVQLRDRHGVTLTGSPDSILVNPKGLGGNTLLWIVTRAEFRDSLRITHLGTIVR